MKSGFKAMFLRSALQIVRRPVYWIGIFLLPLFIFLFLSSLMENGMPMKAPAAVIDHDGTAVSREIAQELDAMQLVDVAYTPDNFTQARHLMQEGKIYGFFLIPDNFEADLLAGRGPAISFYTNDTYFVPASLLYKTFKTTSLYTKAGIAVNVVQDLGITRNVTPLLQPVNIQARGLGNPGLNYAIYLCNSFIPCALQLMILLVTCFSLGQEIKYHSSLTLMKMADGNIVKALVAKLLPQTIIWVTLAIFMESWLFKWQGYPMHGSWFWITLSSILLVFASQGLAIFVFGVLPNLRLSLSVMALLGILTFSLGGFSFPAEQMYPAIQPLCWITPTRYNFLIYIDQALNGRDIFYSRWWFMAYFLFILLPIPVMGRIKKAYLDPVYVP